MSGRQTVLANTYLFFSHLVLSNALFSFLFACFSAEEASEFRFFVMFVFISGSPSGALKGTSPGRNMVRPLGKGETGMEMSASGKKRGLTEHHMLKMLSQGKGTSIFEIANKGMQETGIVDKEVLSAKDNEGFALLHHAARCDQAQLVSFLLDNGADVDMKGDDGCTALYVAVRYVTSHHLFLFFFFFLQLL